MASESSSTVESNGYMVGSKTKFTLDLDDVMIFPDNEHIPVLPPSPEESWVILGEVLNQPGAHRGGYGYGFGVQDKGTDRFPVIFATPDSQKDAYRYKIGDILCIFNGTIADFRPGIGFIVNDNTKTSKLPCNFATLRRLFAQLRADSKAGEFGDACSVCKSRENLLRCGKCGTRYCSRTCQKEDWEQHGHREECRVLRTLIRWNRKEWW
uniref:MYND-type domain-containing protein n=1 Tax=Mycena chlorophos TaxID=658473 RepID=A0ABQ0M406_MYCCL|nr:predicted protein [Mycena chlorophos]